jgi:hypothetical protein
VATPGYLAAYAWFHGCNSGYDSLSTHQKYFQRSVFDFSILNKVNVKYGACFPPGFGGAAATTMGTEIYVRAAKANTDQNPITTMSLSAPFRSQLRLLLHELGHSKQYAARGWDIWDFGWDYMFQYCVADYSYSGNSMEKDAKTYEIKADALLSDPVVAHFKKWRKDNLGAVATYSKSAKEYTNFKISGTDIMSLDLTKTGSVKDGESQRKQGGRCVRILRGSNLAKRTQAEVPGQPWDCVNIPPSKAPTKKPTKKPTKAPTAPTRMPTFGGITTGPGGIGLTPTPIPKPPTRKPVIGIPPTPRPQTPTRKPITGLTARPTIGTIGTTPTRRIP